MINCIKVLKKEFLKSEEMPSAPEYFEDVILTDKFFLSDTFS